MGSAPGALGSRPGADPDRGSDENAHPVVITRGLLVETTEVTVERWRAFVPDAASPHAECDDSCPAVEVSWVEAIEFCNFMSERDGLEPCYVVQGDGGVTWPDGLDCEGYRLPTEAEWEYAARAGAATRYVSGDNEGDMLGDAWYQGNGLQRPSPVGAKAANAWGLHDVHGNVWEWTWDAYRTDYERLESTDPVPTQETGDRVLRGGGWQSPAVDCRLSNRRYGNPAISEPDVGLRIVRTAPGHP